MIDHDLNKPEETPTRAATAAFCNNCDSPGDAYPSHYLEDNSPSSATQEEACYRLQPPAAIDNELLFRFCLDTESFSLAQQIIMNDPESKELGARWNKGDFGFDFAPRLENLFDNATAMAGSCQDLEGVLKALRSIYCGWMGDYYESTQQWSEAIEWRKIGLSMASNREYVACSMHLEELIRDHGLNEEAEELRRARMNIGWSSMGGMLPVFV